MERPQLLRLLDLLRNLRERFAFTLDGRLQLQHAQLIAQRVPLRHLLQEACEVCALLGRNLRRRRVLRGRAVADREDRAVRAVHDEVVYARGGSASRGCAGEGSAGYRRLRCRACSSVPPGSAPSGPA